jgi:hypothetical protein
LRIRIPPEDNYPGKLLYYLWRICIPLKTITVVNSCVISGRSLSPLKTITLVNSCIISGGSVSPPKTIILVNSCIISGGSRGVEERKLPLGRE